MRFKIIIPVVNRDLAIKLMESIRQNTLLPGRVFVIDNSTGRNSLRFDTPFPVDVARPARRLGVNASWNLGIRMCADCDMVSILNDDVILGKSFFERNARLFREHRGCGVACPATVHDLAELPACPPLPYLSALGLPGKPGVGRRDNEDAENGAISRMRKREGWAFSIRRSLLDRIPPVPGELRTFCGDDWFWFWTHKLGFHWYKDTANIVYHKVGVSVRALRVRHSLRREKEALKSIIRDIA